MIKYKIYQLSLQKITINVFFLMIYKNMMHIILFHTTKGINNKKPPHVL